MSNPIKLISKLFKSKPKNTLIHELHTKAIGRPLLAHADMGAMILKGFLNSPLVEADEDYDPVQVVEGIGVIDVSGALVSRPMGWCSPLSYAEIQDNFDALLSNDAVSHIVMRIDSAGGEASNMFDLSDHIYNARGTKPIIAVVDDMAYSAAYGIASACDEVVLSRTGGVGSIGVVAYHIDESEKNKRKGVKVEYLYAGDKKVNGNPNQPLAEEAKGEMQTEINRLYDLFVETVARNRGLDSQAVKDTQAGTYHGQNAVEAGLADSVATFSETISQLLATGSVQAPALTNETALNPALIDPSDFSGSSQAENLPQDLSSSLNNNAPQQDESALTPAQQSEIKAVCQAAGLADVASDYIKAGTLPEVVRADLFSVISAGETEIVTAEPVATSQSDQARFSANWVYQQRQKA